MQTPSNAARQVATRVRAWAWMGARIAALSFGCEWRDRVEAGFKTVARAPRNAQDQSGVNAGE